MPRVTQPTLTSSRIRTGETNSVQRLLSSLDKATLSGDLWLMYLPVCLGAVSQWGEVSKSKKTRSKPKDAVSASATADTHSGPRPSRGGRIVSESGRGRGRGVDRGGRAPRSRPAQPATNGTRKESGLSVPTEESNAWDTKKSEPDTRGNAAPEQPAAAAEPAKAAPPTKTWASMLRQATAPKIAPKPKEPPAPKPAESLEPLPPVEVPAPVEPTAAPEPEPEPIEAPVVEEAPEPTPEIAEPPAELPPTKDALTESNLEQVNDTSAPAPTETAASTAADSWAPAPADISTVPTPAPQPTTSQTQPPPAVPQPVGFAAATPTKPAARAPHYQRRILDQEEAVRMPGNREVDRAAVQFGAFSLNGGEEDIDGEREEAETRAQPPDDSPVVHPRASLPPAAAQPTAAPEAAAPKPVASTAPANAPTGM